MPNPTDSTSPETSSVLKTDASSTDSSATDASPAPDVLVEEADAPGPEGADVSDVAPVEDRRTTCPVCEAKRQGAYCVDCGHAFQDERLQLRPLIRRGISRVFDLDSGLLHTFLELFRRPGQVARDYFSGIRQPYVNPFTYFILAAAVQIISMSALSEPMARVLAENTTFVSSETNIWLYIFGEDWAREYVAFAIDSMAQTYTWTKFFFFAIPLAAFLRLLMGKRRINAAEGIVFSLYVSGHMLLLSATSVVVILTTGSLWYQQMLVYPIILGYTVYGILSCFGWSMRTFVVGGVAVILAFACFLIGNVTTTLANLIVTVGPEQIVEAFQTMVADQQQK